LLVANAAAPFTGSAIFQADIAMEIGRTARGDTSAF